MNVLHTEGRRGLLSTLRPVQIPAVARTLPPTSYGLVQSLSGPKPRGSTEHENSHVGRLAMPCNIEGIADGVGPGPVLVRRKEDCWGSDKRMCISSGLSWSINSAVARHSSIPKNPVVKHSPDERCLCCRGRSPPTDPAFFRRVFSEQHFLSR